MLEEEYKMPEGNKAVRIAIDAMGGDYAPAEVVKGSVAVARKGGVAIILVGPVALVQAELNKHDISGLPITVVNADEVIMEGEPPALAMRQKRNASVVVATKLVKKGEADAVVSAGPTGAVVASALMILGAPEGIERPVVGGNFLGFSPNTVVFDAGGNIDVKPYHLLNFAIMGCVYAQKMLHIANPTVALLSVGAEEGKGNQLVKESFPLFKQSGLNFIGNIEGNDLVTGKANVVVCDGFVGNIILKFGEALGSSISQWLRDNLKGKLPDAEVERISHNLYSLTNSTEQAGGGPLLGVNGVSLVMHGRSQSPEFTGAIALAKTVVESDMVNEINLELSRVRARLGNIS
jgi:glycerol-3-phosphate acyltransferase PlsX